MIDLYKEFKKHGLDLETYGGMKSDEEYLNPDYYLRWNQTELLRFKVIDKNIVNTSQISYIEPEPPKPDDAIDSIDSILSLTPVAMSSGYYSAGFQFVIVKTDDVRIFRRGSMTYYCEKVLNGKHKKGDVDISKMKHYLTIEEFSREFAKAKLLGLDYQKEEFWNFFKFPRKS